MTARNVVIPALAIAGPRSIRAFLVLLNLVPDNEILKCLLVMVHLFHSMKRRKRVRLSTKVWENLDLKVQTRSRFNLGLQFSRWNSNLRRLRRSEPGGRCSRHTDPWPEWCWHTRWHLIFIFYRYVFSQSSSSTYCHVPEVESAHHVHEGEHDTSHDHQAEVQVTEHHQGHLTQPYSLFSRLFYDDSPDQPRPGPGPGYARARQL